MREWLVFLQRAKSWKRKRKNVGDYKSEHFPPHKERWVILTGDLKRMVCLQIETLGCLQGPAFMFIILILL